MNNSVLLRGLSSSTVQIFGVALIMLIVGLTTERSMLARPLTIIAIGVLASILLYWTSLVIGRHHAAR